MLNITERAPDSIDRNYERGWPEHPYRGLNFFTAADALLFGERDDELATCEQLIGKLRTRLLLLHGRSGTGKSSFIRAGLLPALMKRDTAATLTAPDGSSDALIIRCTADPISRIAHILKATEKRDALFDQVSADSRHEIRKLLTFDVNEVRTALADRLVRALALLTRSLRRPLLLVIDQGEEVLVLPESESLKAREAFFWLLEELCWNTKIGLKIIFALRTEYYGQFCDYFRLEPNTKLAPGSSGVEQFMLHGLRDTSAIASAILRPTLSDEVAFLGSPRSRYGFEFAPGLAQRIAQDLVTHCGESSTFPVMQIVCTQLYERIKARGDAVVLATDYEEIGLVAGALEAFVDSRIRHSMSAAGETPTDHNVQAWKEVLGSLVAKREGGAVTTLIVSKAKLVKSARECGLGGPIGKIIGNMARERCRLLRPVEYLVDGIFKRRREYSLGHDALAAALFRWAEAHETIVEARRHSLRKVRRLQLVALGVVVAAVLFLFQLVSQRAGTFEALSAFAESDRSGSYSQRLRLLVASLDQVQSIARPFLDVSRSVSSLRNTLELAPVSGDEGEAFGMSPDGSRFALLNGDRLIVNPIRAASSDGPTELRLSPPQSDNNNESATNSPIVPAVGFVGDLGPVAYRNGTLFYWVDQKPYPVALHTLLPPSLRDSNVPLGIDISGGMIRVWPWRFGASEMEFVAISADRRARPQAAFQSSPPRKITWASQLFPTFSISSPVAVYLERERDADRQSTSNFGVRRITLSDGIEGTLGVIQGDPGKAESNNPSDKTTVAQELFLRSIAFPSNAPGVVVRSERGALEYFPDPKATTRRFHIPDAMQSDPQRPAMFSARPLLAAHKSSDREWKFAWMGPNGINVMKSTEGDRLGAPVVWPPLLPGDSGVDAARSLIFSKDGQYLILTVQRGFRESLKYRLFDLSAARRATIAAMDQSALKQEACRVAKLERAAGASVAQTFVRTLGCD